VNPVEVTRGDGPVILGLPHTGTWLPDEIRAALNDRGRRLSDADWHVDRLYSGLLQGVTTVRATFHRYVIDANRPPDGARLYPGQATTDLVPLTDFDGLPIWDRAPEAAEVARRRSAFHTPYHAALAAEMQSVRARHGVAILYDAHSIRPRIPNLFPGTLPDLNIGTNDGTSCAPILERMVDDLCAKAEGYTSILNGRFKGGWTTRHYGRPTQGRHAVQMELAQSTHLGDGYAYDAAKADRLRPILSMILHALADLAPHLKAQS